MDNKQEEQTFIPTEIMGDYEYSKHSHIKAPNQLWKAHGYKLKFIVPAILFILIYAALFYLEMIR
jgi:hypothetical protein